MIRAELKREVVRGVAFGFDCFLYSKLFVIYISPFFPSDVRCLKGKDNLGGEGIRQRERSMAKCTYRSPALGLFPAFHDFKTHGSQQARVVCEAVGEALPRPFYLLWKQHSSLYILHEADGFFCFSFGLKMKWAFNGMGRGIPQCIMTLVQGQR